MSDPVSAGQVRLRPVVDADVERFFEHQADEIAATLAAFPSRTREVFRARWDQHLADDGVAKRTIEVDGEVAGHVLVFSRDQERYLGYWLGRAFWGRGIASAALDQFMPTCRWRPLYAEVARHNVGSLRVLQKQGFSIVRISPLNARGVEDVRLVLT